MLKAITFDVDNTLMNFMEFKRKTVVAMVRALRKHGMKGSQKALEKELYDFYFRYGVEKEDFLEKFMKKKGQYSDIMLAAAINAYLRSKYKNIKSYPKVGQTLKRLKRRGLKLAVITDAPKLKVLMRLEAMGVADLFDVIVSSEQVGRKKPSTILFRRAIKELKVKPEQALHLGDWRDKDVLGAKRVGMKTCIARYGDLKLGKKVWADYYIDEFKDILKIVKNISR